MERGLGLYCACIDVTGVWVRFVRALSLCWWTRSEWCWPGQTGILIVTGICPILSVRLKLGADRSRFVNPRDLLLLHGRGMGFLRAR